MISAISISVNNYFKENASKSSSSRNLPDILPAMKWISDPLGYFSDPYKKGLGGVVNYLLSIANVCADVYPTQSTIAKKVGRTREHTNVILSTLARDGILIKIKRPYTSCIYILHPIFNHLPFRQKLQKLLPSLRWLPLLLLVGIAQKKRPSKTSIRSGYLTLFINSYSLYIKNLLSREGEKVQKETFGDYTVYAPDGLGMRSVYIKSKERKMSDSFAMNQPLVSSYVEKVSDVLKLSPAGICNISAYDDAVLETALFRLQHYPSVIHKPFSMFMKLCNDVSLESGLLANRSKSYGLATQFGITLGKDDNILSGFDKPLMPKSPVTGRYKQSGKKQAYSAAKSDSFYHFEEKPQASKAFKPRYTLDQLAALNPDIDLSHAQFKGYSYLDVSTGTGDTTWRETTNKERATWNERRQAMLDTPQGKILQNMGIVMPEAPLWFHGDPNGPTTKTYTISDNGSLFLPGAILGTSPAIKNQASELDSALRDLTPSEESLIAWFRDYYRFFRSSNKTPPEWYNALIMDINIRIPTLERKLLLIKNTLEADGWLRNDNGSFIKKEHDATRTVND